MFSIKKLVQLECESSSWQITAEVLRSNTLHFPFPSLVSRILVMDLNPENYELDENNVKIKAPKILKKRGQDKKSNKCNQCDFSSSQTGHLRRHLKIHSGEKTNKCNQCEYASSQVVNKKTHLKTHSVVKSRKCKQCDYASSRAGDLRTHMKMHSGEKPNKCNQCDFASSRASDLRRHLKTHSGEKSSKCSQCDFACSDPGSLKRHMKRHIVEKWLFIILSRPSEEKNTQQIVIEFKYDVTFGSPRQMKYRTSTASSLIDFYRTQVYLGSVLWVPISLTQSLMFCWPNWCVSGGQIYNQCK